MFRFVAGGYDCGNNKAGLQKTERRTNTSSSTATRGCMFVATTSGDVVRCTVHPELLSNQSTRCVSDKEAGDEERSMEDATTTI